MMKNQMGMSKGMMNNEQSNGSEYIESNGNDTKYDESNTNKQNVSSNDDESNGNESNGNEPNGSCNDDAKFD